MYLNAVRFKSYGENENKVWRFSQGTGHLARFLCINESDSVIKDMQEALKYGISGETSPRITEVALQLTDESGDTWIVERTPASSRIVKNGKVIENLKLGQTLLASLLDLDLESSVSTVAQCFNFYRINTDGEEISSEHENDFTQPLRRLETSISNAQEALLTQIAKITQQPLLSDMTLAHKLQAKAEPIFNAYKELCRQRRTLLTNTQSIEVIDESLITQLEQEIALIEQVEKTAQPLLDPANTPKLLKDKIEKKERELSNLLVDSGISEEALPLDQIPWDKLVSCLSKLEAFERLVHASEKIQSLHQERIQNIQEQHFKTIETLLSSDTHITAELESCLTTLSLQATEKKVEKKSIGDAVLRFIKPSADVPVEESTTEKQQRLESARMAIDYALTKLGELHANLAESRHAFDHLQTTLRDHHETLVHEYGKLKSLWTRLSKEHRIPTELNLAELLRLCVRQVQINETFQLKQSYRAIITQRKAALTRLEELLLSYRQVSGSQKSNPLNNHSILVAEAQNLVRYKAAKAQQLSKIKGLHEQMRAYQALSAHFNSRDAQIRAAWKKVFSDLLLPEVSPDLSGWEEVFNLSKQSQAWAALLQTQKQPATGTQIFSEAQSDKAFTFFSCNIASMKPSLSLQLVQALDAATLRNCVIFATPQKDLAEVMIKSGTGSARRIQNQNNEKRTLTPKAPETAANNKMRQLLELLNPKQANDLGGLT